MGSLLPFPDKNMSLILAPTAASSAVTPPSSASALLASMIEPKQEPFDEPPESRQGFSDMESSNFTPNLLGNSQLTPFSQSSAPEDDQDTIFAEFSRISELFHSAFAENLQNNGGVQIPDPNSRAIVPVPEPEVNRALSVNSSHRRAQRSALLVRISDLNINEVRNFRNNVRQTRKLYDSLRIVKAMEEERGTGKRVRGDLKAASMMKGHDLWLNRDKRIVGSIPGIEVGDVFFYRMELCVVGLHGQAQGGIDFVSSNHSSNGEPIATSIIVSGGYEDDQDAGDVIIYTGHGGRDKSSRQCMHQKLEGGNLALERSMQYGIEVRVIRGVQYENSITSKIYVYDGLYKIISCWFDAGKSSYGVFKYKLIRMEGQPEMGSSVLKFAETLRSKPLSARPMGYLSLDMALNKENLPIFVYNDLDASRDPLYYEYLVKTLFPPFVFSQVQKCAGCDCVSGCTEGCFCAKKNGNGFAYDDNGLLMRGKPIIFECGASCQCPPTCRNRVTQRGLRFKLEVFRSKETGWGVRSLDLIQPGSFICEYAGVVLTKEQAEVFSMDGDALIHPGRFSRRWKEWGDFPPVFPENMRPSYPTVPPLDYAMDVSIKRNVACYMSHSSTPNVLVQHVLYDHNNLMFPHLMLFASETIPPLRELSLDYGVADEDTGKLRIGN